MCHIKPRVKYTKNSYYTAHHAVVIQCIIFVYWMGKNAKQKRYNSTFYYVKAIYHILQIVRHFLK